MTTAWSDWKPFAGGMPYVHWASSPTDPDGGGPGASRIVDDPNGAQPHDLVRQIAQAGLNAGQSPLLGPPALGSADYSSIAPVPAYALNHPCAGKPDFAAHLDAEKSWLPDPGKLPDLPDETVIVGVIDVGIPLGHNRWRNPDGSSRILAAWQMPGEWSGLSQPYLPFGRELYRDDIDRLLAEYSGGSLTGWLDEAGFNAATGTLDMEHVKGPRDLAGRHSHGAHVLDAAAGCSPEPAGNAEAAFRDRVRIITVNIPGSGIFGASGTYLDDYMIYAVQRITDLADAIWLKNHPGFDPAADWAEPVGYPVVLNLSFGKQAGSKDTLDRFPNTLSRFHQAREAARLMPVRVVMPVGNDNLLRCNAYLEPMPGETLSLDWRVSPQDQSSNFVEIWTRNQDGSDCAPLELALVPPGGDDTGFQVRVGQPEHYSELGDYGRIYCQQIDEGDSDGGGASRRKFRYVLCTAPTARAAGDGPTAPAGVWKIRVKNRSDSQIQCVLSVQTDQQVLPGRPVNLRSYFDDPGYRVFDEDGHLVESYGYPPEPVGNDDLEYDTPVRRHGTMNASVTHGAVARVAGYRVSDGRPAPYSATGRGSTGGEDDGTALGHQRYHDRRSEPNAALPTEDGPAHFGILAAGSANGSVTAMSGTSFASSQATRVVAEALVAGIGNSGSQQILSVLGHAAERRCGDGWPHGNAMSAGHGQVLGSGRIASPLSPRVSRTGRD